jgi:hypothetical protein
MTSVLNQVKAFRELKQKNDSYEQIDFNKLSKKYGFDVRGTWQKIMVRNLTKLAKR